MKRKPVFLCHNAGVDDFIALALLVASRDEVDLVGVSVVAADSMPVAGCTATRRLLAALRGSSASSVPVAESTLTGLNPFPDEWRLDVYKIDALPMLNTEELDLRHNSDMPGQELLAEVLLASSVVPVTILVTGPLTDLAWALRNHPKTLDRIERVIFMGGALSVPGNVHHAPQFFVDGASGGCDIAAEWNVFWDPAAADEVFRSGVPLVLVPLDATNQVPLRMDVVRALGRQSAGHAASAVVAALWALCAHFIALDKPYYAWDAVAAGLFLWPEAYRCEEAKCRVFATGPRQGVVEVVVHAGGGDGSGGDCGASGSDGRIGGVRRAGPARKAGDGSLRGSSVHAAAASAEKVGASVIMTKYNAKDLLTEIDGQCQQIIANAVKKRFPTHAFLGEEDVAPGADASARALEELSNEEYLWIVDPIDGTTNFVHSMPLSAVSIGVARRGELVAGVIYDPYRDELFSATMGGGAFLNGKQINVGEESTMEEATVAAGAPPDVLSLGPSMRGIVALAPKVRTIRMLGSAAIMLAWVANGRLTAYFEPDLSSWDTSAGALLVQEAGGRVTDLDGSPYQLSTRAVLASNGRVHDDLSTVLEGSESLRRDTTPRI